MAKAKPFFISLETNYSTSALGDRGAEGIVLDQPINIKSFKAQKCEYNPNTSCYWPYFKLSN